MTNNVFIRFNNRNYYLNPRNGYYEAKVQIDSKRITLRLQRAVWEFYNGPIPPNYHIHHIDGDKANNNISNLELLSPVEHAKKHGQRSAKLWQTPKMKEANKRGREKCKEWHASEEGKQWHSEHQKQTIKKTTITKICPDCGREFSTWNNFKEQTFCRRCRDKYLKRELRRLKK